MGVHGRIDHPERLLGDHAVEDAERPDLGAVRVAGGHQQVVRLRPAGEPDVGTGRVGFGGGVRVVDHHRLLVRVVHLPPHPQLLPRRTRRRWWTEPRCPSGCAGPARRSRSARRRCRTPRRGGRAGRARRSPRGWRRRWSTQGLAYRAWSPADPTLCSAPPRLPCRCPSRSLAGFQPVALTDQESADADRVPPYPYRGRVRGRALGAGRWARGTGWPRRPPGRRRARPQRRTGHAAGARGRDRDARGCTRRGPLGGLGPQPRHRHPLGRAPPVDHDILLRRHHQQRRLRDHHGRMRRRGPGWGRPGVHRADRPAPGGRGTAGRGRCRRGGAGPHRQRHPRGPPRRRSAGPAGHAATRYGDRRGRRR